MRIQVDFQAAWAIKPFPAVRARMPLPIAPALFRIRIALALPSTHL
ncbi:hypothetical protein EW145_g8001, partial [Phellinidium pouzarii]